MPLLHILPLRADNPKLHKTYRNPIIFAQELADEMKREGSTQAEFARKHGIYKSQSQPVDGFIEASEEGDRTCIGNG